MNVVPARSGAVGFDTASPLTAAMCESLVTLGYEFAVRYVSHAAPEARDLSTDEIKAILGSGLALMVVMHPLSPGWSPTAIMGTAQATDAVSTLGALGLAIGPMA